MLARAVRAEPRALRLRLPRVGLYQSWVPSMDEGWTRFVFEKEIGIAYRELRDREVRAGRLHERFDAIVLPDQPPGALLTGHAPGTMPDEYTGGLGPEGVAALRAFVEAGGTLVALDSAAVFAIEAACSCGSRTLSPVWSQTAFYCPGSILKVRADAAHPLAHGLPEMTPVWFEGSPAFEVRGRAPSSRATRTTTRSSPAGSSGATG